MMGLNSKNAKKKPYSSPEVTNLTPEQAKQLVADRKNCSEKEAAAFLESLRQQLQNEQPLNDTKDQKWKHSA